MPCEGEWVCHWWGLLCPLPQEVQGQWRVNCEIVKVMCVTGEVGDGCRGESGEWWSCVKSVQRSRCREGQLAAHLDTHSLRSVLRSEVE